MKALIFCVIVIAAQAGAQEPLKKPNPDCTKIKCEKPLPLNCTKDSVLVEGITPPGRCCPQPGQCVCKPKECVKKVCQPDYTSVLVSKGSGKPGHCCDIYECKPNCTKVKCEKPLPLKCPKDSVLVEGKTPPGQCCPQPGQCVCKPKGCVKKACQPGNIRVLVSKGKPGHCCDTYECKPVCYTQWFDRDDPSGTGDHETLKKLRKQYPGKICPKPLNIQAMTVSGVPAENTGQVFHKYDTKSGLICLNSENKARCLDYKVRFGCPCLVH